MKQPLDEEITIKDLIKAKKLLDEQEVDFKNRHIYYDGKHYKTDSNGKVTEVLNED